MNWMGVVVGCRAFGWLNMPLALAVASMTCAAVPVPQSAGASSGAASDVPSAQPGPGAKEDTFPRGFTAGSDQITVYPPNFKSWDGQVVAGTCAISIAQTGSQSQTFGTLGFTASTEVNRLNRVVTVSSVEITGVSLPTDPGSQDRLEREIHEEEQWTGGHEKGAEDDTHLDPYDHMEEF